jgi:hypothetical protein
MQALHSSKDWMYKYLTIWLILSVSAYTSKAQEWILSTAFTSGSILKHSKKIEFNTRVFAPSFDISISRQPGLSVNSWEKFHPRTVFSINASYRYLGADFLGSAIGVFPSVSTNIFQSSKHSTYMEIGAGLAYLTKSFDFSNNTENNAIGSHFNNITNFRFTHKFQFEQKGNLITGFEFSHYSNGALTLPNLGINIYSIRLGYQWKNIDLKSKQAKRIAVNDWKLSAGYRFSQVEWNTPSGPKYPVFNIHIGLKFVQNAQAHWIVGLEYERNEAVNWWGIDNFIYSDMIQARKQAYRLIAFAGREIVFDRWSILMQLGWNLKRNELGTPTAYTEVLGVKRYFLKGHKTNPYLGVFMKANGTVAEYFAIGLGVDAF